MRSVAASLRGLYLRSWRYGPETERLVQEALERERWDTDRIKAWQEERLACVLHRAATQVPYYREQWSVRRRRGDDASWEYLENWPILEKDSVRENPIAFVADNCVPHRMFHEHTSGTTGKPLDLWWSRKTVRQWYALFEARCRHWYEVSRHDRWAILGGQLITPQEQRRPPFWVWNASLNQLYMSSYHLASDLIPYYLDALKRYKIRYILGYTSSIYALAQEILHSRRNDVQLRVIVTNAEPVFAFQRQAIAQAFHCSVRETYGMAELVAAASECAQDRLHLWPEVGRIEVMQGDESAADGTSGDLVCTGLLNVDMPLVRYRVGDFGNLPSKASSCDCGRRLPIMASIQGRLDDVLYTRDGRRIGRLDTVFKTQLPIREAQIIQDALDKIRVRYVPTGDRLTTAAMNSIIERLQDRLGQIHILLEPVDSIPREGNGKFRSVVCRLSPEDRTSSG
jgi:phenylacetate-CoA ligase